MGLTTWKNSPNGRVQNPVKAKIWNLKEIVTWK